MKKLMTVLVMTSLCTILVLASCASAASSDLKGASWSLVSYGTAENPTQAAAGVETTLKFGNDGQVSGSMGCNSFSGDYKVQGDKIEFGPILSTMMACDEPRMSQESSTFQVLSSSASFDINGDSLTISDPDNSVVITLARK